MASSIVSKACQIAVAYGSGSVNTLVGAGVATQYSSPMGQRAHEIERLQKMLNFVKRQLSIQTNQAMPHPEEQDSILIKSDSSRDLNIYETEEDSSMREDSYLASSATILVDENDQEIDPVPGWIKLLKKGKEVSTTRMDTLTKTKYCMTLHQLRDVLHKRLDYENNLQSIDQSNRASSISQGMAGIGQIASATCQAQGVSIAAMNVASGFSILSSIFFLAASLRGIYSFSKQLSANSVMQKSLQEKMKEVVRSKPSASMGYSEKRVLDEFALSELLKLQQGLDILQNEEALLKHSRNYHLINTVGAILGLGATVLFIVGTQGIGLIAYYGLVGLGTGLPLLAMAYKKYATNEAKHVVTLSKLFDQRPPRLPDLAKIQNENTMRWIKEMLKKSLQSIGDKEIEEAEWTQELVEQFSQNIGSNKSNALQFLQTLHDVPLNEQIDSMRYANGIHEVYY